MKVSALAYAAVVGLALAGCTTPQQTPQASQAPRPAADTGNMAYPSPVPQGEIGSTAASGRMPTDTGNMAYPAPQPQGEVGRTTPTAGRRRPTDTGSMAFPRPLPQGNVGTTQVR